MVRYAPVVSVVVVVVVSGGGGVGVQSVPPARPLLWNVTCQVLKFEMLV